MKSGNSDLLVGIDDFPLATDFYELTMAAAFYTSNQKDRKGIFELFVRKLPRNRSYLVAAGLEQAIHFLLNLKFNEKAIAYIKSNEIFRAVDGEFYDYLRNFKFTGTVWAVPEGTVLFPNEPIIRVEGPIIEAQIVETYILSTINFQSLIATKASRITDAAKNKPVIEFGFRRAHGPHAALLASRASYVGGCKGTSNALAGQKLGIPLFGTMAHSFVMNFEKEEEAFNEFNKTFPSSTLLVDTYDSVEAVKKIIKEGIEPQGIRLDSGNLHSLSLETRKILDEAGYSRTKIMASGDLNEYNIAGLVNRGAPIDYFGVGTELTTSRDDPAMNGVYKLVAIEEPSAKEKGSRKLLYRIKTSTGKKTYPGPKQILRVLQNNMIKKDIISLEDEEASDDGNSSYLLQKYLENGQLVSNLPTINEIQKFHLAQKKTLSPEFRGLDFVPKEFPVEYSEKIQEITKELEVNGKLPTHKI